MPYPVPVPVVSSTTPKAKAELVRANVVTGDVLTAYPDRDTPHPFVPVRTALLQLLAQDIEPDVLIDAAREYRTQVARDGTEPRYVVGPVRFFRDGMWRRFAVPRVGGLTREQWARTGRDVRVFDQQVTEGGR